MRPRLIRSELGEGAKTWVPYGLSVDVSEFEKDLRERADELVETYKAEQQREPRRAIASAAAPAPVARKKK